MNIKTKSTMEKVFEFFTNKEPSKVTKSELVNYKVESKILILPTQNISIKVSAPETLLEFIDIVLKNKLHRKKGYIKDAIIKLKNLITDKVISSKAMYKFTFNKVVYKLPKFVIALLYIDNTPVSVVYVEYTTIMAYTKLKERRNGYASLLMDYLYNLYPEYSMKSRAYPFDNKGYSFFYKHNIKNILYTASDT